VQGRGLNHFRHMLKQAVGLLPPRAGARIETKGKLPAKMPSKSPPVPGVGAVPRSVGMMGLVGLCSNAPRNNCAGVTNWVCRPSLGSQGER
jgi:hypothetical protein